MADIFISYKSERRAAAEHLADILTDYGYTVWWDYGLVSGLDFGAQIERELRAAKAAIVLWCTKSVASRWVREEAELAKQLNILLPTKIEAVELPLGFMLAQTQDLTTWDGAPRSPQLDTILRDLATLVGRPAQPNMEGLDRTERAWRRFGAPALARFALIEDLERASPPRTMPSLLGAGGGSGPGAVSAPQNALLDDLRRTWASFPAKGDPAAVEKFLLRVRSVEPRSGLAWEIEEELAGLLRPGREFRDGPGLPLMVVIPAGSFLMGSPKTEEGRDEDEGPQRKVTIARPFAVGKFAVTFDEWDACAKEGGCPSNPKPSDQGWGRGTRPVINVSWGDAQEYRTWLSKKTGKTYRLLSEAEWEYACRAGTTTPFSFGETISTAQANYDGTETYGKGVKGEYRQKTMPVGSFPANTFGLHDMHGNVSEWVQDCYGHDTEAPSDGSPVEKSINSNRVLRGGSWYSNPQVLRSAYRNGKGPTLRSNVIGFRLARTL